MAGRRWRFVSIGLLVVAIALAALPSPGRAQGSAADFEHIVSGARAGTVLSGPIDFTLLQEAGVLSVSMAEIDVADFVAHAAFTNPDGDAVGWDYGFQFRTTGANDDFRVFVTSEGTWNFSIGVEPPQQTAAAPALDVNPGAVNRLDLIVEGDRALFGINGQFAGSIDLPELSPSGDVYASTGFLADLVLPGRIVELREFTVSLPPETAAPISATPETLADSASVARPVTLIAGSCAAPGEPVQALLEATYPLGERQGSTDSVVAETSFTRVPFLLSALLAEPHAIVVAESIASPDETIACADLGGIPDEIGGFVIALSGRSGSSASGIIYLSGDDGLGQTNISVFLIAPRTSSPSPGSTAYRERHAGFVAHLAT